MPARPLGKRGGNEGRRSSPSAGQHHLKLSGRKARMKTQQRRKPPTAMEAQVTVPPEIFSSDLLTPEEERELLASFWECKNELVKVLIRHFPRLRSHRPPLEPWPMAQFIRDYCDNESRR